MSTWEPVDVAGIVRQIQAGMIRRTVPDVLSRSDGAGLLYRGKVNGIHGDSGSGKTWAALFATAQILSTEPVVYVDLEDSPVDVVTRLLALGARAEDVSVRFRYVQPEQSFRSGADAFLSMVSDAALVVIDSTGESLSIEGSNPNADDEVAAWFRNVPKRIAKAGPAVLILDHMPKASDSDLWPIGSQRKRAAVDGAQYLMEVMSPFSREKAGAGRLVCAKDRHGNFARGQRVGVMQVTPTGDIVRITLTAPEQPGTGSTGFEPTGYMERVSRALEAADVPLTFNAIVRAVTGKRSYLQDATDALIRGGHILTSPGANRSTLHALVKPYRETVIGGEPPKTQSGADSGGQWFRSLRGEPGTTDMTGSRELLGTTGNHAFGGDA